MKARISLQEPHDKMEAKQQLLHVSKTKLAATKVQCPLPLQCT